MMILMESQVHFLLHALRQAPQCALRIRLHQFQAMSDVQPGYKSSLSPLFYLSDPFIISWYLRSLMNINESLSHYLSLHFVAFSPAFDFTRVVLAPAMDTPWRSAVRGRLLTFWYSLSAWRQRLSDAMRHAENCRGLGSFTTGRLLISCEATDSWCFSKIWQNLTFRESSPCFIAYS